MKHKMGNSPKCYECKFYTEEECVQIISKEEYEAHTEDEEEETEFE